MLCVFVVGVSVGIVAMVAIGSAFVVGPVTTEGGVVAFALVSGCEVDEVR